MTVKATWSGVRDALHVDSGRADSHCLRKSQVRKEEVCAGGGAAVGTPARAHTDSAAAVLGDIAGALFTSIARELATVFRIQVRGRVEWAQSSQAPLRSPTGFNAGSTPASQGLAYAVLWCSKIAAGATDRSAPF
jgi:hypothetical protein